MKRFLNMWLAALLLFTLIILGTLTLTATARSAPPYPPPADPHDQVVYHLNGPLAEPLSPIIEIEWTRVHSGTLDGVFYDDLYWGGIGNSSPTLVDIDDDGDLDLFVFGLVFPHTSHGQTPTPPPDRKLHFFRNDGTAAAPAWTHVAENYFGQHSHPVQFADLDGDGDLDAVLMGFPWEPEGFVYYENTGSASEPAWTLRTTDMLGDGSTSRAMKETSFALRDIDDDGDLDLFFLTYWEEDEDWFTSIVFYENTGSPSAPAWTFVTDTYGGIINEGGLWDSYISIAFADIDDDGDLDLFLGESGRIRHYRNDGDASASIWTFVTDTYGGIGLPYAWGVMKYVLTFGDLDGNGTLDLVVGQTLGWLTSFKNTGTPANASWTLWVDGMLPMDFGNWANPALADIDNDGDLDLFLGSASGLNNAHFVFLRNDGTPATPLWTYVTGGYGDIDPYIGLKHPTFVDIDGDGDLDLFIGTGPFFSWDDGTLHFYENIGTPEIAEFAFITDTYLSIVGPSATVAPAFADIDGDGDYDLFVAVSGQIHYYRNDGDATLPVWTFVTDNYMGIAASALAFCDVDGDSDLDMFTDRAFYRNDGDAAAPRWVQRGTPQGLAWSGGPPFCGDLLGGDGRPDLLLGGNGGVHLYRNLRGIEIEPPVYDADAIVVKTEAFLEYVIPRLEAGELDVYAAQVTDPGIAQQVATSPNLEGYRSYGSYDELTFNPSGPTFAGTGKLNPFAVPRVREAMNWLVDREHVAQQIHGGMATPRWHALNTASSDYAALADVARGLEAAYRYDKALAGQAIAQEMIALGATLIDDVWHYSGEPVEIILLIRTEDKRLQIGDYVADQLEDIGFTVIRSFGTSGQLSPIWINGNPADGLFHIYTGGWVTTSIPRDSGGNFAFFYTNMGSSWPLWQAYVNTPEFYALAAQLNERDFATLGERRAMMAQALDWALEDSVRIWLVDRESLTPRRAEVSYASDLFGGMTGSWLWPHTLERTGSFTTPLTIGSPAILTSPWNPLNGGNWIADMMLIRATGDPGVMPDPYTGLVWPQRIDHADVVVQAGLPISATLDWVEVQFAPSIEVPGDAWVDWDATQQRFLTAAEVFTQTQTALRKSVVTYPDDLYDAVTWHDGSPFSAADVILNMILAFDRYKVDSPVYDPTEMWRYDDFMATFKGLRILSTDPLIIEHYGDDFQIDAELNINAWWPFYNTGPGAWHALALGLLAEADGEAAFSQAKAGNNGVPWLDYIAGSTLDVLAGHLATAQAANYIPYAPTLGQYITTAAVADRWDNLAQWYADRGHFWIGTGPLYLEQIHPPWGELSLKPYLAYPDAPDRWDDFGEAPIPDVAVEGPEQLVPGEEAVYNIQITLNGQPYPDTYIEAVHYLVIDPNGQVLLSGDAVPVGRAWSTTGGGYGTLVQGLWRVTLDADMTSQLPVGANQVEIVVVSNRVVIPTSSTQPLTVLSTCPMDMDGDDQVTVLDIQDVANRWLAEAASGPPYDIRYDVAPPGAPDGVINIADIQMIAAAFMSCPIVP